MLKGDQGNGITPKLTRAMGSGVRHGMSAVTALYHNARQDGWVDYRPQYAQMTSNQSTCMELAKPCTEI